MSCVFQQQDKSFNSSNFKKDLRLTPAGPTTLPLGFLRREGFFPAWDCLITREIGPG